MIGDFLLHPRNRFEENEIVKFKESISNKLGWQIENLGFRTQINLENGLHELVEGIPIFRNFPHTNL
jgi:hypothetical protein